MNKLKNILFAFISSLFIISLSVILGLNFRPLYYINVIKIQALNENLSTGVIRNNYDILINYLNPFYTGKLKLDSLVMSTFGEFHFYEVKQLFNLFYILFVVTLLLGIIFFIISFHRKDFSYLKSTAFMTFLIPIVLGIPFIVDFDWSFVAFHEIAFSNDYWLFDPKIDPVINILPQWFFMEAAFLILLFMIVFAIFSYMLGRHFDKKPDTID